MLFDFLYFCRVFSDFIFLRTDTLKKVFIDYKVLDDEVF